MWDVNPHPNLEYFKYLNVRCTKSFLYARRLPHCICVGIPMGCDLFTIYDSYINYVFPWKCNFVFDRIYPFIYVDLWHPILNEISWFCWDPINCVLITFCLRHVLFPINSCPIKIMPVAVHMIRLIYVRVVTLEIIIVFCINYFLYTSFYGLPPISSFLYFFWDFKWSQIDSSLCHWQFP